MQPDKAKLEKYYKIIDDMYFSHDHSSHYAKAVEIASEVNLMIEGNENVKEWIEILDMYREYSNITHKIRV
ncbi:MAG: hypothetical protein IPO02_09780 [Bacteroidetes bacterium]|nr:hypothetical protein [Bacteroidota bacterium]